MNLIYQFKSFWDRVPETKIRPSATAVYFALLFINNRCGWKKKFTVAMGEVMYMAQVDKDTYYRALKSLKTAGFIEFAKGKNQFTMCEFEIKVLYDFSESTSDTTSESMSERTANAPATPQANAQANNPKHINNKHKTINKARPGSIEDVVAYFLEQRIKDHLVQADKFFNFYEAKGWKIGKSDIKDWKACVKTWKLEREEDKPEVKRALTKEEYYKAFAG